MHASIWGFVGASAGLAFAVGLGKPRFIQALIVGFGGALSGQSRLS